MTTAAKTRLHAIAFLLTGWINNLPDKFRRRFYKSVEVVAGALTLAILVLPLLPAWTGGESVDLPWLHFDIPAPEQWTAFLTAALTFVSALAGRHTPVEPPEPPGTLGSQDDEAPLF